MTELKISDTVEIKAYDGQWEVAIITIRYNVNNAFEVLKLDGQTMICSDTNKGDEWRIPE